MAVKTPCVGVCSTGIGDSICRGCKRYAHEVIDWNGYSDMSKQTVVDRLELQMKNVVAKRMVVVNPGLLREKVAEFSGAIRYYESADVQAFELIKCVQGEIDTAMLTNYGIELRHAYWRFPLRLLFKDMDDELYALAQAYYERYFGRYQQVTE